MTRLTPEQIKPFILHADVNVRDVAARYFADGRSADPTVMPLVIEAWEKYGLADGEGFSAAFTSRPLAQTADTVEWLIGTVARLTGRKRLTLARTLAAADIALLQPRAEEVHRAVDFEPRYYVTLTTRLDLATWDGDPLWQRLAELCERAEVEEAQYAAGWTDVEFVVEALGRHGDQFAPRTLEILARRFDPQTLGTRDVWLVCAAVRLAGELRLNAAARDIVAHMQHDWELLDVEAQRSLVRIGTDDVIRAIAEVYQPEQVGHPTGFKIYSTGVLGGIRSDLAVETCLRLFEREADLDHKDFLGAALVDHLSAGGARRVLAAVEAGELGNESEAHLPAVCTILGIESPVADRLRKEHEDWLAARKAEDARWEADRAIMQANAARLAAKATKTERPPLSQPLSIQGKTTDAGRNDKCPCGSGKKYKKCCMGKAKRN